jgi:hypothetical protein
MMNRGVSLLVVETGTLLLQLVFVKRRELGVSSPEDPFLDEVRKRLRHLVFGEYRDGYAENLIQLLQG